MEQIFVILMMADVEIVINFSLVPFQREAIITYDKYTDIDPVICKNFHK